MKKVGSWLLGALLVAVLAVVAAVAVAPGSGQAQDAKSLVGKKVAVVMKDSGRLGGSTEHFLGSVTGMDDGGLWLSSTKRADWSVYTDGSERLNEFDYAFNVYIPWEAILFVKELKEG